MPKYEYSCPACGNAFEVKCSFSDADKAVKCPKCKTRAKKQISLFMVFTKGSGGDTMPIAGGGGGCSSCSAGTCSTCGS